MAERVHDVEVASQARGAARSAAEEAGLTVRALDEMEALEEASGLFERVWDPDEPIVGSSMLRALSHADNYVAGAYDGDRMLGAIVGFLGRRSGELELHSHVLGVLEGARGRNVGFALKQHQRAWALERGLTSVTWTFDPLVRRNAYFNLTKLGARVTDYYENFYGSMDDGINGSDDSDRVLVTWRLDSAEAIAASVRRPADPDRIPVGGGGQAVVLSPDGESAPEVRGSVEPMLLAWIPPDIVQMRKDSPLLARGWRLALRESVGVALRSGYVGTGVSRGGWMFLERSP